MGRRSLSQRRAKEIVERTGGDRIRRGHTDRLEVGHDGLFERTGGSRILRVGGELSERVGGSHTTHARRVERTVRGGARIEGRDDTILLGGAMSDVHAGAEVVLAGMSDDLLLGAGTRVTAPFDIWLTGILGVEEKLATTAFDGAVVDVARTLFEREYGTGVHHAASASFTGAVYATQATGFRKLMKVSSGVRNLSSGGGGGGASGDSSASAPPSTAPSSTAPSSAATSPGAAPEPGLLASVQSPSPGTAGTDSTDFARIAGDARTTEDAAHYTQAENVSDTAADLQEAARLQGAGENPDEVARMPSRAESAADASAGSSPSRLEDAAPAPERVDVTASPSGDAIRNEPGWAPPSTHKRTYTKGQVPIGQSFEEFNFDAVLGTRPDKLLSDDAQASMDTAAFRIAYDAKNDVTDMARNTLLRADPRIDPATVSDMTAVEAHDYLVALQNGAVQAGDAEEARRLQDLLNELDHYAFDVYTAAIDNAESVHATSPMKLHTHVNAKDLEQRLRDLADEQFVRMNNEALSDAERHEASKLGGMYLMAAQDTSQGLDPLAHIQGVLDSGLDQADAQLYSQVASDINTASDAAAQATASVPAARSLWARARDIASSLLSFAGFGSGNQGGASLAASAPHQGGGLSLADELAAADTPIRFVDDPPGVRAPDAVPPPDRPVRVRNPGPSRPLDELDLPPIGPDR